MTTPANGEADSPMANRGCVPRSSSATRKPSRRAIIASSDPPNPDPTIARSVSSGAVTQNRARNALYRVHRPQPVGTGRRTATDEQSLDVPQVGEHAPTADGNPVLD